MIPPSSPTAKMENDEVANGSSMMVPLEIEEETMSLFEETAGSMGVVSKLTFRKKSAKVKVDESSFTGFRGLLRSKTAYTLRNILFLFCIGLFVFLVTTEMDSTVESLNEEGKNPRGPHQSSFGGSQNPSSIAGAKAYDENSEGNNHGEIDIPMDNVGQRVPSISTENAENQIGHYFHDPHKSPWSSPLYRRNATELQREQEEFLVKQNESKAKYGCWDLVDPYFKRFGSHRPSVNFSAYKNRDMPTKSFTKNSWQTDPEYIGLLINEAKKLIDRVREGIYELYGHPSTDLNGIDHSEKVLTERAKMFQIITENYSVNSLGEAVDIKSNEKLQGVAYLNGKGWIELQRKLLHAIITEDDFFVVLVGDGNAAGHGNNFRQSSIMNFHYILEPILRILGIRLVSRNMAMKDVPIILSTLAGADIYGEADILLYSSKTEEADGSLDLLYKQSVMSGERVPVILTDKPGNFIHESMGNAWMGNLQSGHEVCGTRKRGPCNFNVFNSACWVERTDFTPETPQDLEIPSEAYESYHTHQLEGYKLALLVLEALDGALHTWAQMIASPGVPHVQRNWHVGPLYDNMRESIRTFQDSDEVLSKCEKMMGNLRIVCRVEMHGFTEFTPRVTPSCNSLGALLPAEMDISNYYKPQNYRGIDLLPLNWKIPDNQTDVHMISIATSAPARNIEDDDDSDSRDDKLRWDNDDDDHGAGDGSFRHLGDCVLRRCILRRTKSATNLGKAQSALVPGKGWMLSNPVAGFCDGSSQSTCGRQANNSCLLAGHNDHQSGILGDGSSGWLLMMVENVREGIILVRFGSTDVGSGDSTSDEFPSDFLFDFAISGIVTTLSRIQFHDLGVEVLPNVTIHPLLLNETMYNGKQIDGDNGKTFEVAIRIRSAHQTFSMTLTHLYFA